MAVKTRSAFKTAADTAFADNTSGDITDFPDGDYATAAQGALADTAVQPADPNPAYTSLSASRSTVAGDDGADIESTASSAVTLTVAAGTVTSGCTITQMGAGAVTVAAGTGVTIHREGDVQAVTNGQYAVASLKPTSTADVFVLTGSLAAQTAKVLTLASGDRLALEPADLAVMTDAADGVIMAARSYDAGQYATIMALTPQHGGDGDHISIMPNRFQTKEGGSNSPTLDSSEPHNRTSWRLGVGYFEASASGNDYLAFQTTGMAEAGEWNNRNYWADASISDWNYLTLGARRIDNGPEYDRQFSGQMCDIVLAVGNAGKAEIEALFAWMDAGNRGDTFDFAGNGMTLVKYIPGAQLSEAGAVSASDDGLSDDSWVVRGSPEWADPVEPLPIDLGGATPEPPTIPEATLTTQSSITDDAAYTGMTATLSDDVEGGQDENSKWLLRMPASGEIRITGFSTPSTVDTNDRTIHGCMIDPFLGQGAQNASQGFDSLDRDDRFNELLNVDPGYTGEDIVITAAEYPNGCTIKKALSKTGTPDPQDGVFQNYFEITIVPNDAVVPDGFYCPVHRQHDKREIYSFHHLNTGLLPSTDISGAGISTSVPTKRTVWCHAIPGNGGQREYGYGWFGDLYGRNYHNHLVAPFFHLMSDAKTDVEVRQYMSWLVPLGLECLFSVKDELENGGGRGLWGNGGHMQGRFQPAVLAAMLLGEQQFYDIVARDPVDAAGNRQRSGWHEKDQTWVVSDGSLTDYMGQTWPENHVGLITDGPRDKDPLPYQPEHVGLPEWGEQHVNDLSHDTPDIQDAYRNNNMGRNVQTFSLLVAMGAADIVSYEPLWSHADRYARNYRGLRDGSWPESSSSLYSEWDNLAPDNVGRIDLWDTANTIGGRTRWTGQPESLYYNGSPSAAAANTFELTLDLFVQLNGGTLQGFDVAIIPRLPDAVDVVGWEEWETRGLKDRAIILEDVPYTTNASGSYVLTVNDGRLGQGQEWELRARAVTDISEGAFYWHNRGTMASGNAKPVCWEDPSVTFPGLQGIDETATGASDGVWTGYPTPTISYRWEITDDDGATVSTISGATGADYTYTASEVGYKVRRVTIANNSEGSAEIAGEWSPAAVEADPVPFIDRSSFYLGATSSGVIAAVDHGFDMAGKSYAVTMTRFGSVENTALTIGGTTVGVANGNAFDGADSTSMLFLIDVPEGETDFDLVFTNSGGDQQAAIYPLSGPAAVHGVSNKVSSSGDNNVTLSVDTVWGGGVLLVAKVRFEKIDLAGGDLMADFDPVGTSGDDDELFASLDTTRNGTASAALDYDQNFNRSGILVSIKPAGS